MLLEVERLDEVECDNPEQRRWMDFLSEWFFKCFHTLFLEYEDLSFEILYRGGIFLLR